MIVSASVTTGLVTFCDFTHMDVGQNGRPLRGPQMEKSSLVFTIQLLGYLILTHTHMTIVTPKKIEVAKGNN